MNVHLVDLVLLFMVHEGAVLIALRRRSGRGLGTLEVTCMLGAGAALLLALRAVLAGAAFPVIGAWLVVALLVHLADLYRRWNRT